jgi:hypothetical protein
MPAGPASTTSPAPSGWTATRSAPCWSPPGSALPPSTPWSPCWPSTGYGSPRPSEPTSKPSGVERGHRTLKVLPKGGKTVTIPLAPRTARTVDLAVGERCAGPIFTTGGGRRLDRHSAARIVRRVARRAEIAKPIGSHTLRPAFHHRRPRRRRPTTRRPGSGLPRRPAHQPARSATLTHRGRTAPFRRGELWRGLSSFMMSKTSTTG